MKCGAFLVFWLTITGIMVQGDEDRIFEDELYRDAMDFFKECGGKFFSLCLKEKALKYVERLPNDLELGGGIRIKPNYQINKFNSYYNEDRTSRHTTLPDESRAREEAIDKALLEKIADYLGTHSIEFKMPVEAVRDFKLGMMEEQARKKKGGEGGGDKKGGMMPYILMFYLKAATLGAITLKFIAMVAFKALVIAKVAFTISSIIALKKLLEHKHHTSTYEVLATHPHYEDYGHYDRSFSSSQDLAYGSHKS